MKNNVKLIVGLGNPGESYLYSRHNVGFMIADLLASSLGHGFKTEQHGVEVAEVISQHLHFIIIKPQTFMNRSGEAVLPFVKQYQLKSADILVVHDDIDLAPGKVKFSSGGGDGGHRGIRSVTEFLKDAQFCRLKIGIGRPIPSSEGLVEPVEEYVLADFCGTERELLQSRFELILEGMTRFLEGGVEKAMNAVNGRA